MESMEPVDFVELFLDDYLMSEIVKQTNFYAAQKMAGMPEAARKRAWTKDVDLKELKDFFGLVFLTGLIHKPELRDYWTTDEAMETPYFGKVMSRNRYQAIMRFLHFTDRLEDKEDRIFRIRPVMDYLVKKWQEMYTPLQNISIDEGTLLFRGRLSFRVYNPTKPCRYGIKSFLLCCSQTAYCHNMRPYIGVYSSLLDTVTGLLGDLMGKGYVLFMDNFYNSVSLSYYLLDHNTHTCGTIRRTRGAPPEIDQATLATLKANDRIAMTTDKVMCVAWRDSKVVRMLSSYHQDTVVVTRKWQKGGIQYEYQKPQSAVDYNAYMNGVDKLDQHITYYPFTRKSTKWTTKFLMYLFEISLYNAFVLYRIENPQGRCKELKSFIHAVVKSWSSPRRETQRAPYRNPRVRLSANIAPLPTVHVLAKLPPTEKKQNPQKRCRMCSEHKRGQEGKRSETTFQCVVCHVPLHKGPCHIRYHTEQNLPYE